MSDNTIDKIQIEAEATVESAVKSLKRLRSILQDIRNYGNSDNAKGFENLRTEFYSLSQIKLDNFDSLATVIREAKTAASQINNLYKSLEKVKNSNGVDKQAKSLEKLKSKAIRVKDDVNTDKNKVDLSKYNDTPNYPVSNNKAVKSRFGNFAKINLSEKMGNVSGVMSELNSVREAASKIMFPLSNGKIDVSSMIKSVGNLKNVMGQVGGAAAKISPYIAAGTVAVKALIIQQKIHYKIVFGVFKLFKKIGSVIGSKLKEKLTSMFAPLKDLLKRGKSVAISRLFREGLMQLQQALTEGIQNVAKGVTSANVVMSKFSTQLAYMKNSIGAALVPLLQLLYPLFYSVTETVIKASNAINQFLSLIAGKTTYIKAQKNYVDYADTVDSSSKKAKKSIQKLTASFDELNDLTESVSDTSSGDDMTAYFTTAGIESNIDDFYKKIRDQFNSGDMSGIGETLASKFNTQIAIWKEKTDWRNIGEKITTSVNSITSLLNTMLEDVDWDGLGTVVGNGITTIFRTLLHFNETFSWIELGASIAGFINGAINSIDFVAIGEYLAGKLVDAFKLLDGFLNGDGKDKKGFDYEAFATNILNGIKSGLETVANNGKMIGNTIGDLLYTAFDFGTQLFGNKDLWISLGNAINEIVNGLYEKKDETAQKMSDFLESVLNGAAALLETIDWGKMGDTIITLFQSLDTPKVREAVKNVFKAIIKGALSLAVSALYGFVRKQITGLFGSDGLFSFTTTVTSEKISSSRPHANGDYLSPSEAKGEVPFRMNQNEIVGKMPNGKSAVANNVMIVAAIRQAAYEGITLAMRENSGNDGSGSLEYVVVKNYVDGKNVGEALAKPVFDAANRQNLKVRA